GIITSNAIAFIRSGRFSVRRATPGRGRSMRTKDMAGSYDLGPMPPIPLDEYPLHQVPLSLEHPATSDPNFYDRCYFNGHDRTGDIFLITGMGVYPNLGVIDAYATVRRGDTQFTVRASDALGSDRMQMEVGPYRVEVLEPLQSIRLVCDGDEHGVGLDLTWTGSFPAVEEAHHV